MSQKRSLSGIKPTGTPHLGNYLGMIRPAIDLQEDHEAFYFVADYHALTTMRDADQVRDLVYDVTAYFLAFGLDPERAAFFRQSDIPEVTELTWMLSCVTHMGLLERAHAYKKAKEEGRANEINHGIFAYPVLMASDILIYDSDVVPVGSGSARRNDQRYGPKVQPSLRWGVSETSRDQGSRRGRYDPRDGWAKDVLVLREHYRTARGAR